VLPKENNFPLLPIPECRYIDPEIARCELPRPPPFESFSNESLRDGTGFRQWVVAQELDDGWEAIYSGSPTTFFPVDDRPFVRSQKLPASLRVSFNLRRRWLMCSPKVVGSGSSSSDFRYLSRTGTSGKKAMNP
jgi:hypothetical protein